MQKDYFKKRATSRGAIGTIFCVCLMLTSMATAINISQTNKTSETINVKSLSYTFLFEEPNLQLTSVDSQDFTLVEMKGCNAIGKNAGEPMIPVKPVKLLLPPMKDVKSINIIGNPVEIELNDFNLLDKPVFPYQNPIPIGDSQINFIIDYDSYSTNALYPGELKEYYHIGYSHGYSILDITLNPLQYNPASGELKYYPEMIVNIELQDSGYVNTFYRNNPNDKAWVEKLVCNPEITDMYTSDIPTFEYPGGLCDPSDNYDYVIITTTENDLDYWSTSEETPYNWESLINKHQEDDGFNCTLVTVEEIDDCIDYHDSDPIFNDQQAHIREFCKDAYEDWGTCYVLIAGDADTIPARQLYYQYEGTVDSDLYWSNLNDNFNADHDSQWGEAGDNGFDLYSELYIGRVTCDSPQDASNWMKKSFYYADSFEDTYLDNAAFYGGDTGWNCQGDDFVDYSAIKGTDNWLGPNPGSTGPFPAWAGFQFGFETWNEENLDNQYNLSVKWTAESPNPGGWQGGSTSAAIEGLKTAINNDQVTLISGIAHANPSMSLDVDDTDWESQYHNTKPFFITDYGCHCGDFNDGDGVLESMLFHSDTKLAFGCVYNTGYGWGQYDDTNSSSSFQQKQFWNYFFNMENYSGDYDNWQLGKGHAWSKDSMAPTIDWDYTSGTWRGVIECCLLFGDPAQLIKTPHPSQPPVTPEAPEGPSKWIKNIECTFSAVTTDPEGEQIYYLFDWDDGNFSDWLGPYESGQSTEAFHAWSDLGDYEVKVKARDIWGAVSDWSEPLVITISENQPPANPTIKGPSSGNGGKIYNFTFVSTDPEEHNIYYRIDWDDGSNTGWIGPYNSGEQIALNHSWNKKGEYLIKAWAKDIFEGESQQGNFRIKILTNGKTLQKNLGYRNLLLIQILEKLMNIL
jgi:hypothetical protein